jgi:hypothetical protein
LLLDTASRSPRLRGKAGYVSVLAGYRVGGRCLGSADTTTIVTFCDGLRRSAKRDLG